MKVIKGKTLTSVYASLIDALVREGHRSEDTYELLNTILEIEEPSLNDIYLPMRKISKRYLMGELNWYWNARNDVEYISKYAKMWSRISDDGETSNSAYGYIIHKKHKKDQLLEIYNLLKDNIDSRKAVINIIDPTIDKIVTKDLQCTVAIQFIVRNNKLHMTVFMRSNDIYFGLPYDALYFMTLQKWLSDKLGIDVGKYVHHATSMHVYIKDIPKLKFHDQVINLDNYSTIYDKDDNDEN